MSDKQEKNDRRKKPLAAYKDPKKTAKREGDGSTQTTAPSVGDKKEQPKTNEDNNVSPSNNPIGDIFKKTKLPPIKIQFVMDKLSINSEQLDSLISSGMLVREGEGISGESFFNYYRFKYEQNGGQIDKNECERGEIPKDVSDSSLLDIVYTKSGYKITHKKDQSWRVNISRDGANRIVNILEV